MRTRGGRDDRFPSRKIGDQSKNKGRKRPGERERKEHRSPVEERKGGESDGGGTPR